MLSDRKGLPTYPDGVLEVRRARPMKNEFGAKRNIRKLSETSFICTMCYCIASIREQDFEFAERSSFKLSMKVKCPRFDLVKSEHLAVIGDVLYDISHIDATRDEMFLYLEEVGRIDSDGDS